MKDYGKKMNSDKPLPNKCILSYSPEDNTIRFHCSCWNNYKECVYGRADKVLKWMSCRNLSIKEDQTDFFRYQCTSELASVNALWRLTNPKHD